ncbi:hypothetical protein FHW69_000113 [Luteibacter sp. Sphag1AF]|uniref:hypothetical protein n=1 Tax=Luteibacter sp. Sphag1AF TaxID=2587031 RepID=UPI00161B430E|nr:hypothetical protein [Luteibacter sp. Sphag1AF]MBB3225523.1 hypothetical protein [Luteibacter sp. Sphag1AF]
MHTWISSRRVRALAAAALVLTSAASVAQVAIPSEPLCPAARSNDGTFPATCLLWVKNAGFESGTLQGWNVEGGHPSVGTVDHAEVLVLARKGDQVSQVVALPANTTINAATLPYYVPALATRVAGPLPAQLKVSVSMLHPDKELPLFSRTYEVGHDWMEAIERFDGAVFPQPASLLVRIERADSNEQSLLYVDKVSVTAREQSAQ